MKLAGRLAQLHFSSDRDAWYYGILLKDSVMCVVAANHNIVNHVHVLINGELYSVPRRNIKLISSRRNK